MHFENLQGAELRDKVHCHIVPLLTLAELSLKVNSLHAAEGPGLQTGAS